MSSFVNFRQFVRHGGHASIILSLHTTSLAPTVKQARSDSSVENAFERHLRAIAVQNWSDLSAALGRVGIEADLRAEDVEADIAPVRQEFSEQAAAILEATDPDRARDKISSLSDWLARRFLTEVNERRQRLLGIERYVWRSRDDEKVRAAHAGYDDRVFLWDEPPDGGHPGQAYNCRCYAEPFLPEVSVNPVDPQADPVGHIEAFLNRHAPGLTAGQGVRPRESILHYGLPPEPGVTVNGEMLDVQVQGDLATAFLALDEAVRNTPQTVLNLLIRHGEDFAVLANAFGRTAPGQFATAALLSASGAPSEDIDRVLTATRNLLDRFVGGFASALVEAATVIQAIPDLRWSDIQLIAHQIYEDPTVLPEAMVAPFRERIAVGDYGGAIGFGLPEVLAGIAGLGRLRWRAADLPEPLPVTRDMLDAEGRTLEGGLHNAGAHAPRFDNWIDSGGLVHMTPQGHFAYTADLEILGRWQRVTVVYRDGYPDFTPFMTHPSGVRSVEIEMTGIYPADNLSANLAAGLPEWGRRPPHDWSWHHSQDGKTMQLIPSRINRSFYHKGGAAIVRRRE